MWGFYITMKHIFKVLPSHTHRRFFTLQLSVVRGATGSSLVTVSLSRFPLGRLILCVVPCACVCVPGGQSAVQWSSGSGHAHGPPHGPGRELQELQQQTGLDLWVCHRGQPALQGGPRHPGASLGPGERGLRGARSIRQFLKRPQQSLLRFSSIETPM